MRSSRRIVLSSSSPAISTNGYQTLFMPIRAAAVSAALASAAGAADWNARTSSPLRAAKAAAIATPSASSGARVERAITESRFRRMSFAVSGSRCRIGVRNSIARPPSQRVAADRAVARAQLVGLQAVEDAQHLVRIAANVQVVHRHVLDHVVRVDDEGRAQRDAGLRIAHAELVDQRALDVGKAPVRELVQVLVLAAPAELGELVVGRAAEQHGVALVELTRQLVEADDLGGTDER